MGGIKSKTKQTDHGNRQGDLLMTIQHCGGWGYGHYANEVMTEVDKMYPGKFRYILIRDGGVTGTLELTVQKNQEDFTTKNLEKY